MAQTEQVRTFVAVELPDEQRLELAKFVDSWRKPEDGVRWVAAENLHLTLSFLGNVPRAQLEKVAVSLQEAVAPIAWFELQLGSGGSFPERGAPRVIWIGLQGDLESLQRLQRNVIDAVRRLGLASSEERFSPHITLGRVRPNHRASLAAVPALTETPAFPVSTASLMASNLTPQRAHYTRLALLPLQQHQNDALSQAILR